MFVDSHCHLDRIDLSPYGGDLEKALAAARGEGVSTFLSVSIDLESFPAVLETATHDSVWASVGVHPLENDGREPTVAELVKLASHPRVVALGETGLDYYRGQEHEKRMKERFINHLQAAKQVGLPVIVHTREASCDTIELLGEYVDQESAGVIHCFTESWEFARAAMDMNFYISFSGIVTFKNAQALQEVARQVPLDRMLIETDSPYLAPVPYRGRSNEPRYVADVARYLAKLKGVDLAELAEVTRRNFFRLFNKATAQTAL